MDMLALRIFCWLVVLIVEGSDTNEYISFGALLNTNDEADVEEKVFKFAVDSVDRSIDLYVSKSIDLSTRYVSNPFDTSKQVCSIASSGNGVAAIFGPSHATSSDYVRSFSSKFKIPHLEIHPDSSVFTDPRYRSSRNTTLSLWPDLISLRQAYEDIAERFEWSQIMVITSTTNPTGYLPLLTHILEKRNIHNMDVVIRPVKNNKEAVAAITASPAYKNIIVDLLAEDCVDFTKTAAASKLLSGYYHYHFTTLDLYPLADAIGPQATGAVNVTTFSLIDYESDVFSEMKNSWKGDDFTQVMTKTKNALIYDSVRFVSKVLGEQLSRNRDAYPTERMSCNGTAEPQPWSHGASLYRDLTLHSSDIFANAPQRNTSSGNNGVTGKIRLDKDGRRRSFSMHLLEFDTNGDVRKVGRWSTKNRLVITKTFDTVKEDVENEFRRIEFTVAVKEEHPAVFIKNYTDDGQFIPEDSNLRYSGFSIDLMKKIAEELKILSYHFVEVKTGSKKSEINDSWSGIVGGLITRQYDIGLSPITVTVERSEDIDFTTEYLNLGISILYKRAEEEKITLFQFMAPFHESLWGAIFAAFLTTSFVLHIVGRFSPKQWDNPHPCSPEVELKENDLGPSNSIWFALGSFLQQGTEIMPKSTPTRIIATFWWLFCLICVSSYTANLAAFLTKSKMKLTINSADDLSRQTEVNYGCFATGSTRSFFAKSTIPTFAKMNTFMIDTDEIHNVASGDEGVAKVLAGKYAYIMESVPLKYELSKNCSLIEIGGDLNSIMYSIALPKHSPYTNLISDVILKLKEDQTILSLYNYWWGVANDTCKEQNKEVSPIESNKLGLPNFAGVFLVLGSLLVFAFIVLVIEMTYGAYQDSKENKTTVGKEFLQNFKFGSKCCSKDNDQKPAKWSTDQKSEHYEDEVYGSLDRLSLSIGTPL